MTINTSWYQKFFHPLTSYASCQTKNGLFWAESSAITIKKYVNKGLNAIVNRAWSSMLPVIRFTQTGGSMNLFGRRISLIGDNRLDHVHLPLEEIDRTLTKFTQRQPLDARGNPLPSLPPPSSPVAPIKPREPAPCSALTPAIAPSNPPTVINQMAETDHQVKELSQNLIYFIPLYTMAYLGDIQDSNLNETIIAMVNEASKTKQSLKNFFYQRYGDRLTRFQKIKIWFFDLIGSSSFFSKTISSYMEHILGEMRQRLANARWTEKGENTERLINDLIHFLDLYKNATFNYAESKKPTGSLSKYRENAAEGMFQKSLQDLSKEFSSTLIEHLSPTIKYFSGSSFLARHANSLLNKLVRHVLNRYLPTGIHSIVLETNAATKPHQFPFVKALTDTATEQLQKLLENLDEGPTLSEPLPAAGTKRLKDAVENLLYVVQFSKSTTQESILAKKKELDEKKKSQGIDVEIQQGIQDSILKGIQILLHHLAEPVNSEEMFTQFCKLANISFSTGEIITDKDLQNSKDKLDLTARNLGKRLAKEAIEERFLATRPEQLEKTAEQAFHSHYTDTKVLAEHLDIFSLSIANKIDPLKQTHDILSDLDAMVQLLQPFSTKEQIAADLKNIVDADRESILRPFIPVYSSIEKIAHQILRLQELQLLYKSHLKIAEHCQTIDDLLALLAQEGPSETGLQQISLLEETFSLIAKYLPQDSKEVLEIKTHIRMIRTSFQKAQEETKKRKTFLFLDAQIQDLKKAAENNQIDLKKANFIKILQTFDILSPTHKNILLPLIRTLNHLSPQSAPNEFNEVWETLSKEFKKIHAEYETAKNLADQNLTPLSPLRELIKKDKEGYDLYRLDNLKNMTEEHKNLANQISALKKMIEKTNREILPQISPQHLGVISGIGLGILSWFYPTLGLGLAAATYTTATQVGPLAKGGSDRAYALGKIGLAALIGSSAAFLAGRSGSFALLSTMNSFMPRTITALAPPAAIIGSAALGGMMGSAVIDKAMSEGQNLVFEKITEFFDTAYEFLLSGEITKPIVKIVMHEVVTSF